MDKNEQIFSAIKQDNLPLFNSLVQNDQSLINLSLGRFPLLSLCYLYKARKIAKHFFKQLNNVTAYNTYQEPDEIYHLFKKRALNAIRFFIDGDIIAPIEMLAALDEREYLSEHYPKLKKSEQSKGLVAKIYAVQRGMTVNPTDEQITLTARPVPLKRMIFALTACALALILAILPLSVYFLAQAKQGDGTQTNPLLIYGFAQLEQALTKSNEQKNTQETQIYYKLMADITIVSPAQFDFYDQIDGNNRTIFINPTIAQIEGDTTYFVKNNYGTIKNLNIEFNASLSRINTKNENLSVAALAYQNEGTIQNISLKINAQMNSEQNAYTSLSGLCVLNGGTIENSTVEQGSLLKGFNTAMGAFAVSNSTRGLIKNCLSYSNFEIGADKQLNYFTGGITAENFGTIEKCKSLGNMILNANSGYTSCVGGISAFNGGKIDNCGTFGTYSSNTTDPSCVGGIVGYNNLSYNGFIYYSIGYILNSFSAVEFITNENAYFGGIIGYWLYYSDTQHTNNYFVSTGSDFGLGALTDGEKDYYPTDKIEGFNAVGSLNELEQTEVYWQ